MRKQCPVSQPNTYAVQAGAARQHDARHSLSDQSGRTASTCPSTSVYGRRWKEAAHAAAELGLGVPVGDAVVDELGVPV